MAKQPFLFIPTGDSFAPVFSGFAQSSLSPVLEFIKDGSGYRVVTVDDYSVSITGGISGNFTNTVTRVGVTGSNGVSLSVASVSGFGALPVFIASGGISVAASNPVLQVGVTGSNGIAANVQLVSGFNAIPVFIVSGQGSAGGSSAAVTQVGITGANGVSALVDSSGRQVVFAAPSGAYQVQGVSGSGVSGNMPNPVLGGAWVNPVNTGTALTPNSLQSFQMDTFGNVYVSLGTSLSSSVDSVSVAQTGGWMHGITGSGGNALSVVSVSGFQALPVFLASGNISSTTSNPVLQVGISGSGGNAVNVSLVSGFNAIPVFIVSGQGGSSSSSTNVQGVSGSGVSGNMPNPVLGGAWVNPINTGIGLLGNTLQAVQMDTSGNIWVSLGTALSNAIDSVATSPKVPTLNTAYAITLTGVGVFNNYTGFVPAINGNLSMSMEPHSSNSQPIYYSFSGTASTGQAWELRGDRTIEIAANTGVFFAQTTGSQIVCVHVQTF